MSTPRQKLQEVLCQYTTDTLICMNKVKSFCESFTRWTLERETELIMMMDIQQRVDLKSNQEFLETIKTMTTKANRRAKQEMELASVLKDTLQGLEELDSFLDAVERLAVTSKSIFKEENRVLKLPEGITLEVVQSVITATRQACPLIINFKRDTCAFFLPKLSNIEVLAQRLHNYIQITQKMCEMFEKSEFCQKMTIEPVVNLDLDFSDNDIHRMLCHINECDEIRKDHNFRLAFLLPEESRCHFLTEFSKRQARMLEFLDDFQECAVQLDRMNMGAKISSVVGSSMGAIGSVVSIIGLALIPVTAGASLALTMTGLGLGITSGVNSAVTAVTEFAVNRKNIFEATEILQRFMKDVQKLVDCLENSTSQEDKLDMALVAGKVICKVGVIGKNINKILDAVPAVKASQIEEIVTSASKMVAQEGKALRNVPKMASDIPDISRAAIKGPLVASNSVRAGLITVNALFIGIDIFFVVNDSISLAKGSESKSSQFIKARGALWRSEVNSWQKIRDSLCLGLQVSENNLAVIKRPFYPEKESCPAHIK